MLYFHLHKAVLTKKCPLFCCRHTYMLLLFDVLFQTGNVWWNVVIPTCATSTVTWPARPPGLRCPSPRERVCPTLAQPVHVPLSVTPTTAFAILGTTAEIVINKFPDNLYLSSDMGLKYWLGYAYTFLLMHSVIQVKASVMARKSDFWRHVVRANHVTTLFQSLKAKTRFLSWIYDFFDRRPLIFTLSSGELVLRGNTGDFIAL